MDSAAAWNGNWAWSLPLIVLNVVFHVICLGLFNTRLDRVLAIVRDHRRYDFIFVLVMGVTAIWATLLHAVEAGVWAVAYRTLGALPDSRSALLYSLSAITTYGHSELFLAPHWRLMGALEALNGIMLFGLTTAFMYGMIQRVWPIERRSGFRTPAS
jgi:hypothetical protein